MQKHLFIYAGIFAALILGILVCLGLIAYMLLTQPARPVLGGGARLVQEVVSLAAV